MATSFPTSLDTLVNPLSTDTLNSSTVPHNVQHANANDAIEALQAKIGINGSLDINSIDNKVADLLTRNTGTNAGDETDTTIKTKLGITTLSGANTGDQDLSGYAHLTDIPTTLPASDVYLWAKQATKPTYVWSEIGSKPTFATVATSGSYTDLSNKPTIPAAQVQTDWNASTGLGVLLNKPDLSSMTNQGNTFNGASQLVKLDPTGKLPAVDGSLLTGISGGFTSTYSSNRTYMNQRNATLVGTVVSNHYQTSIQIRKDITINGIAFYPYSLSSASFNTILGIYNVNSDGHATTLIAQTAYTAITVAGFYNLAITPINLIAGNYALVLYSDTIVGNPYCYFYTPYSHDDIFGLTSGAVPNPDAGYYFNGTTSSSAGLATNVTALPMAVYSKSILMGVRVQ